MMVETKPWHKIFVQRYEYNLYFIFISLIFFNSFVHSFVFSFDYCNIRECAQLKRIAIYRILLHWQITNAKTVWLFAVFGVKITIQSHNVFKCCSFFFCRFDFVQTIACVLHTTTMTTTMKKSVCKVSSLWQAIENCVLKPKLKLFARLYKYIFAIHHVYLC